MLYDRRSGIPAEDERVMMDPTEKKASQFTQPGLRVSLLVDSAMLIAGIIAATQMHADISQLKESQRDASAVINDGRIVRIEEQLRETRDMVKEVRDQLRREESRRTPSK